ncbi:MAG: DUF2489 domain-containing protein [Idiomarina sp.]
MTMNVWWISAIVIGVAIIVGLAFYAGSLLGRLKRQQQRQQKAIEARNERLIESIVTIARSMDQDQCSYSEGALRLTVLLDLMVLEPKPNFVEEYPGLHDMYERIKHMPTHEARKTYPKLEIRKMDAEREGYEVELADAIKTDIRKLLERF